MGIFDKLVSMVRMDPDPEDEYEGLDGYDDEDYVDDEPVTKSSRRSRAEEYVDPAEEEPRFGTKGRKSREKVVPIKNAGTSKKMEVCSIKPTSMDDSQEIVKTLLSGKAVVLNLGSTVDNRVAQSIVDFTCGACYAIGGTLRPVSQYIFLITPKQVNMTGDFLEDGESNYKLKSFSKEEE